MGDHRDEWPHGGTRARRVAGMITLTSNAAAKVKGILEQEGVKVIVDPMSLRHLEGAEVDYKEDLMGGGFAIKNPNAKSTCGCGHSFQAGGEGGGADAGHGHQH